MSFILGYRDAVLTHIQENVPEFKDVGPAPGTFTEELVKRYAMKSPACRVAFLGVQRVDSSPTGELRGPVHMAAYIIAEDEIEPPLDSFDVATKLAEKLAGVVECGTFGYERAAPAELREIQNLFSMMGEKRGTSLLAVTWWQVLRFGLNTYDIDTANEMILGDVDDPELIFSGPDEP